MNTNKLTGTLLIAGSIALLIPYHLLMVSFEYPDILRKETSEILNRFHDGGDQLIWTWFAFALTGLPLLPAYLLLGRRKELTGGVTSVATPLGIIGLVVQMIGLLRWTFVVPIVADAFVNATDEATRRAAVVAFKTIHQFGGVILGEHLGQLFTIAWTVLMTFTLTRAGLIGRWMSGLGYVASAVYLVGQLELLATVMKSVPYWEPAGFIGSTLWLLWLMSLGFVIIRRERSPFRTR